MTLSVALHVQAVYANNGQPSSSIVAGIWEIKVVNMFVLCNRVYKLVNMCIETRLTVIELLLVSLKGMCLIREAVRSSEVVRPIMDIV